MSGHEVKIEVKTRIDFHGVDGVSIYQGTTYKRAEDCDCPAAFINLTAKAAEEGVAMDSTRLMVERLHAALGEFLNGAAA